MLLDAADTSVVSAANQLRGVLYPADTAVSCASGQVVTDSGRLSVDEVGRRLLLRASAIRFCEQRGLIGSMESTNSIQMQPITGSGPRRFDAHTDGLTREIERLDEAREFLRHVRHHHQADTPDGCPHFEELVALHLHV